MYLNAWLGMQVAGALGFCLFCCWVPAVLFGTGCDCWYVAKLSLQYNLQCRAAWESPIHADSVILAPVRELHLSCRKMETWYYYYVNTGTPKALKMIVQSFLTESMQPLYCILFGVEVWFSLRTSLKSSLTAA